MVRETSENFTGSGSGSPKRLTLSFLSSLSAFITLWAKRTSRASTKLKPNKPSRQNQRTTLNEDEITKMPPKSPLITKPKELFSQISNKMKRRENHDDDIAAPGEFDFGDGGVWQRSILMGDKCQPLDFSGVIYYDSHGKQLDEVPPLRSPRASPLPGYLMNRA